MVSGQVSFVDELDKGLTKIEDAYVILRVQRDKNLLGILDILDDVYIDEGIVALKVDNLNKNNKNSFYKYIAHSLKIKRSN